MYAVKHYPHVVTCEESVLHFFLIAASVLFEKERSLRDPTVHLSCWWHPAFKLSPPLNTSKTEKDTNMDLNPPKTAKYLLYTSTGSYFLTNIQKIAWILPKGSLYFLVHTVWIVERRVLLKHASVRPLVQFPIASENAKETVFLPMRKTCWLRLPCAQKHLGNQPLWYSSGGKTSSLQNETKKLIHVLLDPYTPPKKNHGPWKMMVLED